MCKDVTKPDDIAKVALVESSLHSNYTRKRPEDITIYQLINRILLLYQKPLIFVFYKKENKSYRYLYDTYRDFFFRNQFYEEILKLINYEDNGEYYYCPDNYNETFSKDNKVFPHEPRQIGETGYYYVLAEIRRTELPRGKAVFKAIDDYSECLIKEMWLSFLNKKFSKVLKIEDRIKKSFDDFNTAGQKNSYKGIEGEIKYYDHDNVFSDYERKLLKKQLLYLSNILSEVYDKISRSPLLMNDDTTIPNVFFFIRYYDEGLYVGRSSSKSSEASRYPFSLRCIIPDSQIPDIKKALRLIRKSERDTENNLWMLDRENNSKYKEYKHIEVADKFWAFIKGASSEEIISIITSPYRRGSVSLVDSPLNQGFMEFRSNIYINGGEERLSAEEVNKGFDNSTEIKKYVIFHYLLSIMANNPKSTEIGAIITPLRSSSVSYCALLSVTHNDSEVWLKNYHFFTGVARHAVRKLRRDSKRIYLKQLGGVINSGFIETLRDIKNNKSASLRFNLGYIFKKINKDLHFICRVWPCPKIQLESTNDHCDENSIKFLGNELKVTFKIMNNPYFGNSLELSDYYIDNKKIRENFDSLFHNIEHAIFEAYKVSHKSSNKLIS